MSCLVAGRGRRRTLSGSRGRPARTATRVAVGVLVLAFLASRLGGGPFVDGLRALHPAALLAALALTAGTTACCALRWSLVSARVGERVPLPTAFGAYYRSQLLNVSVPGGVAGDVHRGWRHGWRGVVWERGVGQAVQLLVVGALLLPAQWRWAGLLTVAVLLTAGGAVAVLSALSTVGHLVVFLVAAAGVGADLPLGTLVAVGALVLVGSEIPLNLAGWGPREGVAAWAFTLVGASASTGLAVAVGFGLLSTLATLPGLLVLGGRRG